MEGGKSHSVRGVLGHEGFQETWACVPPTSPVRNGPGVPSATCLPVGSFDFQGIKAEHLLCV